MFKNVFAAKSGSFDGKYLLSTKAIFLKKTYQIFAGSLMFAAVFSYIGLFYLETIVEHKWLFMGAELISLVALMFTKKSNVILKYGLLFLFTALSGMTLAPIIGHTIASSAAGLSIIANTFLMTSVAFGGISLYAVKTNRDFSYIGGFLFAALLILIVGGIANIFLQNQTFHLILSGIGALIFSIYILYDTQNILKGSYESEVDAAVSLYLDFINLFLSLLNITNSSK
jgi:modulator of FtsH protease